MFKFYLSGVSAICSYSLILFDIKAQTLSQLLCLCTTKSPQGWAGGALERLPPKTRRQELAARLPLGLGQSPAGGRGACLGRGSFGQEGKQL